MLEEFRTIKNGKKERTLLLAAGINTYIENSRKSTDRLK